LQYEISKNADVNFILTIYSFGKNIPMGNKPMVTSIMQTSAIMFKLLYRSI